MLFSFVVRPPSAANGRYQRQRLITNSSSHDEKLSLGSKYRQRRNSESSSAARSVESQHQFWSEIGNEIGVNKLEDWYSISSAKLPLRARSFLRAQYKSSFYTALKAAYPQHEWNVWKFLEVPHGYWDARENRLAFMDSIGKQLSVNKLEDWYRVTRVQWYSQGGKKLSRHYSALPKAVMDLYPTHGWIPWKFDHWVVPRSYWQNKSNRKRALEWLADELHLGPSLNDWYKLTVDQLREHGLYPLLSNYYDSSFASMLKELHPEHDWLDWLFPACPRSFWSEKENRKRFLEWAAKSLSVKSLDDWYSITAYEVRSLGGGMLSLYRNSLVAALLDIYPEHRWDLSRFGKAGNSKEPHPNS